MLKWLADKVRRNPVRVYLYGVAVAAIPILTARGVIQPDEAPVWQNVAAALLYVGGVEVTRQHVTPSADPRDDAGRPLGVVRNLG